MSASLLPGYVDLLARLEEALEVLPDKPDENPDVTLRALWSLAAGVPRSVSQALDWEPTILGRDRLLRLEELVARRLAGEPLAHITGRQDFMGLVLKASPAALVPRRETELLARHALSKLPSGATEAPLVLDVCAGAGNVTLALAACAPSARVFGSDLDAAAVALARENAELVGRRDVTFRVGDLLAPFDEPDFLGAADLITCNPPYISSSRVAEMPREISAHEPALAFDGGAFGVSILRRLSVEAPRWLKPGGWLASEVGAGQGPTVSRLFERSEAFDHVDAVSDEQGLVRVISARRSITA